jgi:DNA-binding IclR family transcriptional regulator
MCIHQATPVKGLTPALAVSYERGRAMPLYRGATSKIILACLPQAQLKQLLASDGASMVAAGLPGNLTELGPLLREMREAGFCVSTGEVDPDAVGFAVALRDGEHLLGSLSIVMPAACMTAGLRKTTLSRLQSVAGRVEGRLQDQRMKARATKKMENS